MRDWSQINERYCLKDPFPKFLGAAGMVVEFSLPVYAHQGLTLSHYDAKAHLVVARRVLDSLTPDAPNGAVGAFPPLDLRRYDRLVHRTGASAWRFRLSFGLACYAIAALVFR
jgi:hypothetical protein